MSGEACKECAGLLASNVVLRDESRRLQKRDESRRLQKRVLRAENKRLRDALEKIATHRDISGPTAGAYMAKEALK